MGIKSKILVIFLFFLLLIFIKFSTSDASQDVFSTYNGRLPLGVTGDNYYYNSTSQVMTDSNGMTFKTQTNGVITVNDERFMAFALKGMIGQIEIIKTSLDYTWTWHKFVNGTDVLFWAENNDNNLIWRQYYQFYDNPFKPMKISHYIENNYSNATNVTMYYLFNVLSSDTIEYNFTSYNLTNILPVYKKGNFNNGASRLNLNGVYDFMFDDIINDGFTINEFYLGSGSVLNRPQYNITAIGFTKNNGIFNKGQSVWVDPSFSTSDIESIDMAVLDSHTFVIAWCDETADDITFSVYDTNGTQILADVDVDDAIIQCGDQATPDQTYGVSVDAFNSSLFVVGYDNISASGGSAVFKTYDKLGNQVGTTMSSGDIGSPNGVSVSALNSTNFVGSTIEVSGTDSVQWYQYYYNGTLLVGPITPSTLSGVDSMSSIISLNSTNIVSAWWNGNAGAAVDDISLITYYSNGTAISGVINVDTNPGYDSFGLSMDSLSSSEFVIAWYDDENNDTTFRTYLYNTTAIISATDVDTEVGEKVRGVSVSSLSSTDFVVAFADETDNDITIAIYNYTGSSILVPFDIETGVTQAVPVPVATASRQQSTGIELCEDNFVVAWANTSGQAVWNVYNISGAIVSGNCDVNAPSLSITYPTQGLNSSDSGLDINYTVSDANLQACWWTNNSGSTNTTLTCGANITTQTWGEGSNSVRIYANDSLGNINNSESVNFTVDTISPNVGITTPSNNSFSQTASIGINYTVSDSGTGLTSCKWTKNSGTTNTTITCGTNVTDTFSESSNTVSVYSLDYANNENVSSVTFTVDLTDPQGAYNTSTSNSGVVVNRNYIEVNVTASDTNLDSIVINIYNVSNSLNQTNRSSTSPLYINLSRLSDGLYFYNSTINDSSGRVLNLATRNITLDTLFPSLNITGIETNQGSNVVRFNHTASDLNSITCKYEVYNSSGGVDVSNTTITCGATNSQFVVSAFGSYNLTLFVTDGANENSTTQNFTTIASPAGGTTGGGGVSAVSALIPVISLDKIVSNKTYSDLERAVIYATINNYCSEIITDEPFAVTDFSDDCVLGKDDVGIVINKLDEFGVGVPTDDFVGFFGGYKNKDLVQTFTTQANANKFSLFVSNLGLVVFLQIDPPSIDAFYPFYSPSGAEQVIQYTLTSNKPLKSCEVLSDNLDLICTVRNQTFIDINYTIRDSLFFTRTFSGTIQVTTDADTDKIEQRKISIVFRAINVGNQRLIQGGGIIGGGIIFIFLLIGKKRRDRTFRRIKEIIQP